MIWYLLYPFRGTAEAPVLAPSHPLRSALTRYGRYAARHVVTTLLISVAVAAILIYPFPFLFTTDFTNGASNLPHHVWTVAQRLAQPRNVKPDVIMRSIWVHGSYMKALERDILLGALELQDQLLGPTNDFNPRRPTNHIELEDPTADLAREDRDTFHVINGLTNQSWFFHSPLQYWGCSPDSVLSDQDILKTVNQKKTLPTSVNVTLRHSIVFSGKRFEDRRLLAADALVITLIHLRDSPVGRQWERKIRALASSARDKWDVYPSDGIAKEPELYEFQFRPMSTQDTVVLALAYGLTLLYFMMSLSKLRAFKSKTGLMITVIAQIIVSIMSSFTVCAIFKVDLSRIPQAAYPVVVLSMSLENVFRLINAVISTPSEDSTSTRVGHAFGETAYIGMASSMQNVCILWGLSKLVSSGVSEFCTFVAVAIIFDFFYLSTFFLSVLSVDVRRTELSDALAKASGRSEKKLSDARRTATEAIFQGRLALSTRIAGTIVMIGCVLIVQWHFFEEESLFKTLARLFNIVPGGNFSSAKETLSIDLHQARSPTSWLRLQDHDTAREVINVIKPWAHSYIAEVYEPTFFVRKGSNRQPDVHERPLLPALYDFFHHQLTPFIVTILFCMAAVRLLTNFLLWGEETDDATDDDASDEPLISVKHFNGGHVLDVAMLAASSDGRLISVGLDRLIRVWDVRSGMRSYVVTEVEALEEDPFPILALAVDDRSQWLALLSSYRILLWNLAKKQWGPSLPIDLFGQKPEAFFFMQSRAGIINPLIVIRRNGTMTQLWPDENESADFTICNSPLVSAWPLVKKTSPGQRIPSPDIVCASRRGSIHLATYQDDRWISEGLDTLTVTGREAYQVLPLATFAAFLVVRSHSVDLVDGKDNRILHTFRTEGILPRSLKCCHSSRRKPQCGSMGVASLSLTYTSTESGDCVIQTYLPQEDGDAICFRNSSNPPGRSCCPLAEARETKTQISNPGSWEALPTGCVVGIRKKRTASPTQSASNSPTRSGLWRRTRRSEDETSGKGEKWEIWLVSKLGRQNVYETMPLQPGMDIRGSLLITELGPLVKVGTASVAVGFGNMIKLISIGHEHFENLADEASGESMMNIGSRRRRAGGSGRPRPQRK